MCIRFQSVDKQTSVTLCYRRIDKFGPSDISTQYIQQNVLRGTKRKPRCAKDWLEDLFRTVRERATSDGSGLSARPYWKNTDGAADRCRWAASRSPSLQLACPDLPTVVRSTSGAVGLLRARVMLPPATAAPRLLARTLAAGETALASAAVDHCVHGSIGAARRRQGRVAWTRSLTPAVGMWRPLSCGRGLVRPLCRNLQATRISMA